MVITPNKQGILTKLHSKNVIEKACCKCRCTKQTPFMQAPLIDNFEFLANTPTTQSVVDGTYYSSA
jgi:hypothetical protein